MRRRGCFLSLGILLFVLGIVMGGMAWLAGTTAGARWLVNTLSRLASAEISIRSVEGRLSDRLDLSGIRIGSAQQTVEIDRLALEWNPLYLLLAHVDIGRIAARGVRIRDDGPRTPLSLKWPKLPDALHFVTLEVSRLGLNGLEYRKGSDPPVIVHEFSGTARWQSGHLILAGVRAAMPSLKVEGTIDMGMNRPSLVTDLTLYPEKSIGGLERFVLHTRLQPAREPEQAAGAFTFAGAGGNDQEMPGVELSGEAGVEQKALRFRNLRLTGDDLHGTLTGGAAIDFSSIDPSMTVELQAAGVDLARQIGTATNMEGTLSFAGTTGNYRGRFAIANTGPGWHALRFSGAYEGHEKGMKLTSLAGTILKGTLGGDLKIDWTGGVRLEGAIRGRKLDPSGITPDWKGLINFDLAGSLFKAGDAPLQGDLQGTLLESRLHGRTLTGNVRGAFAGESIRIEFLNLHGRGFSIHAAGELDKRLALDARISDLSRLVPGASGTLNADGWIRRDEDRFSGAIRGRARALASDGLRIDSADLTARIGPKQDDPLHMSATLHTVAYNGLRVNAATLEALGTGTRHTIQAALSAPGAETLLQLAGGYADGRWQGHLLRFSGRDAVGPWHLSAPAALSLGKERMSLGPLVVTGTPGERIEAAADLFRPGLRGNASLRISGLNLARFDPWLTAAQVRGVANGEFRLDLASRDHFSLKARTDLRGTIGAEGRHITVRRLDAALLGSEKGLSGTLEIGLQKDGMLHGTFYCAFPVRSFVPDRGEFKARWSHVDLALLRPWLPSEPGVEIRGLLGGGLTGLIRPAKRFELAGSAFLAQGAIRQRRGNLDITAHIDKAEATWAWREESLSGTATLALADYGKVQGRYRLPIPARFPATANPQGRIEGLLTAQIRERGLLAILFPGAVQESQGNLELDLAVGGQWKEPQLEGKIRLANAGAYIPSAGIRLKDVQMSGRLEKDALHVDSFRAVSGPGHVGGTALLRLKEWKVSGYRITMAGERFRTVYFPELQLYASPRLTVEGTPDKLAVRGEVHLPELHIAGSPVQGVIRPSPDVKIEGRPPIESKAFPLDVDLQILLTVGDRAFVKLAGIDAQLGGALQLRALRHIERITSTGEIRIVKGRYQAYGVTLEIVRGRFFYAGGAIDRPSLDVLALRTAGSVRAGVLVTGTAQSPVVSLYSEPSMEDVDILSYIVLGRPLGRSGEQVDLLTMAAESLLSAGQSVVLQDKLATRLGLSSLEISTRGESTPGWDAYTARPLASPGSAAAASENNLSRAMATVGKYLTPKLYISYGRSLFTGSNRFLLRYDLHRNWQVETQTGTESGVDLYYKIEFR